MVGEVFLDESSPKKFIYKLFMEEKDMEEEREIIDVLTAAKISITGVLAFSKGNPSENESPWIKKRRLYRAHRRGGYR
jgi:hypothetical protein